MARILVPVLLLAAMGAGIFYVRLLNGPISLKMLAAPIANSLSAELGDYTITIDDAIARLTPTGDVEFRLRDVQLMDSAQRPVAIAPLAAFSISGEALWSGLLTPERIVLIEPTATLLLAGSATARPSPVPHRTGASPAGATQAGAIPGPPSTGVEEVSSNLAGIDVLRTIARSVTQKSRNDAASFLKQFGFRQATIVLDHGDRKTTHRLLDGDIDLDSWRRSGAAVARFSATAGRGRWSLLARMQQNQDASGFALTAALEKFIPAALTGSEDSLLLSSLALPVSAELSAELSTDGVLETASGEIALSGGTFVTEKATGRGVPIENGRLSFTYSREANRIDILPSVLALDGKRLQFIGGMVPENPNRSGAWYFALRTESGVAVGPDGRSVPIDQFDIDGRIGWTDGSMDVSRAVVRSGASEVQITAGVPAGGQVDYRIEARTGGLELEPLKALWPRGVASEARDWIIRSMKQGRITSATLRVEGRSSSRLSPAPHPLTTLALEASDAALLVAPGWPVITIPRALVRIDNHMLEANVPEGQAGPQNRPLMLRQGRFVIPDLTANFPQGEVTVRPQGSLGAALALLDGESKSISRQLQTSFDGVDGRFEGQVKLAFPLDSQLAFRDVQLEGKGRVTEGRGRGLIGGLDVQGATLNIDLSNEALDVQGDLLLQGVPAKLSGQHLLRAAGDIQPPIRITAKLDAADRNQLGLDINHLVSGDVPVEILVVRAGNDITPKVQANLTGAELTIEPLGWRKAPGRAATLQFDIQRGQKHRTELQNFRIAGEDIAISGWLGIDAQNKLREVQLSDFVLNLISRLEVSGNLRSDNVWDMRVKGNTFDGRDFFRSLLQVGRAVEPAPGSRAANRSGMDLRAEIDTVLGHSEQSIRSIRFQLSRRGDKLVSLQLRGVLEGGKPLDVTVPPVSGNDPRRMVATSEDAGQVFKLVGFYPNAEGGRMRLSINLDGRGPAEKTGLLEVASFRILGDPVVYEVISGPADPQGGGRRETRTVRQAIDFDRMRAPFSIGYGQFVLEDADLRGPLLGATLRGKVDFRAQTLQLGGTYVPLQGLNSALGVIPGLGQILAGPRGEGVLGMTFAIQGPMAQPQVIVNPLSLVAPGIFREMFQMTNPTPRVTPRSDGPAPGPGRPSQSASPPTASQARPPAGAPSSGIEGWRTEGQR